MKNIHANVAVLKDEKKFISASFSSEGYIYLAFIFYFLCKCIRQGKFECELSIYPFSL